MRKEDIEISLHDGMLTISGERKDETPEGDKTARTERFVGKFPRRRSSAVVHSRQSREQ
jgi:HSP20 family molecular chaperone IbpA